MGTGRPPYALISKPYGRRIWQSWPPFKRTRVQQEVLDFFKPQAPTPEPG